MKWPLLRTAALRDERIEPECKGVAGRFIWTLKEECVHLHDFDNLKEAREVIGAFIERYNNGWLLQRHGYLTPARGELTADRLRPIMVLDCPMKAFRKRFSGVSAVDPEDSRPGVPRATLLMERVMTAARQSRSWSRDRGGYGRLPSSGPQSERRGARASTH